MSINDPTSHHKSKTREKLQQLIGLKNITPPPADTTATHSNFNINHLMMPYMIIIQPEGSN